MDWYALGVLIYEMIAGYPPFYDEDHYKLYEKILIGKLRFPPGFDPDVRFFFKKKKKEIDERQKLKLFFYRNCIIKGQRFVQKATHL